MTGRTRGAAAALLAAAMGAGVLGCENKAQTGALVGAGGGAALGAIIGHQSGHAGAGALIGGAVGAGGGYIVGNEMDKKDQREDYERSTRSSREGRYYDAPPASSRAVGKREVLDWHRQGVKDEIIIDRIQRSGSARLTPRDEDDLRDAGLSEEVVRAMKYGTAR